MAVSCPKRYQNKRLDNLTYAFMLALNIIMRSYTETSNVTLVQGSCNGTSVSASGGTHAGMYAGDITSWNYRLRILIMRKMGACAWFRPYLAYTWSAHIHFILNWLNTGSASANGQQVSFRSRRSGLRGNARDAGIDQPVFPKAIGAPKTSYRRCVVGCHKYEWQTASSTNRGEVKVGEVVTAVWITGVNGEEWFLDARGHCYFEENFTSSTVTAPAPAPTADTAVYLVTARPSLYGLAKPGSGNTKVATYPQGSEFPAKASVTLANGQVWKQHVSSAWALADFLTLKPMGEAPKAHGRLGQYNVPGPDKWGNSTSRARAAAALLKTKNLDVIGLNELVGPGTDGNNNRPSGFASTLATAMGEDYELIVPTTTWNETYILARKSTVNIVKRVPDAKIYAKSGSRAIAGRHVTRVILEFKESGRNFGFGATHLVSGDPAGARAQAPLVHRAVRAASGNAPIFIAGDMNIIETLTGFTYGGMKNARTSAKVKTNEKYATFYSWKDTKPRPKTDNAWKIDQIYVPQNWTIDKYEVVLGTDSNGNFTSPRPSDHMLVVVEVTEN